MYELKYSSTYKSSLKKLKKSGKWNSIEKTLQTILVMLQEKGRVKFSDPNLNKRHNDHELYEDKLYERGTHEVHVKPSVLLVYITKGNTVTLLNISSHSGSKVTSSLENLEATIKARLQATNKNAV